jgi:anthranilate/para-aminobenzoate synthase component II
VGVCLDLVRAATRETTPMPWVCLGHQAIGQAFMAGCCARANADASAKVFLHFAQCARALPKTWCERTFSRTRYHSLVIERSSAAHRRSLEVSAETDDGSSWASSTVIA